MNFHSSTSNKSLFLTNLLHVLVITKNLLSVSKFCRDNNVIFEQLLCFDQETKCILLQGYLKDDLYIFPDLHSLSPCFVHSMTFTVEHVNVNQWHERFGHCSFKVLKKDCCVVIYMFQIILCFALPVYMVSAINFPFIVLSILNLNLRINLHWCVGTWFCFTFNGTWYYVSFVDAYTKFTWIYLIHQ